MRTENGQQATVAKGQKLLVVNETMEILLAGEDTNNEYVVVESRTEPGGGVPLLHTHSAQESFYVLEGEYEVYRQDEDGNKQAIPAPPGTIVHVGSNEPHGFANVGDTTGRVLLILEPAGTMEYFFLDIGIPVENEAAPDTEATPPNMEEVLRVCAKHNIHFVEAPPA